MNKNSFQHVDLRVNDLEVAWVFYAKILPIQRERVQSLIIYR